MKRLLIPLFGMISFCTYAQWNTDTTGSNIYYNSGNVGIGTTTPSVPLEINYSSSGLPSSSTGLVITNTLNDGSNLGQAEIKLITSVSQYDWSLSANDDSNKFRIYSGSDPRMVIDGVTGNVGIGTTSPSNLLDLKRAGASGEIESFLLIENLTKGGTGLGTSIDFGHRTSTNVKRVVARIATINESSFNGAHNNDAGLAFFTMEDATSYERIRIDHKGNLGIGTTNPDSKLTVNGTIHSSEVKVDLSVPGPDYVFEEDYNLKSLEETEAYIKANKHLPEIPSAKEMEANGVQLGEMNMLLLKKIEELTLHLIEKDKEMDTMRNDHNHKIDELVKRIEKLENQ